MFMLPLFAHARPSLPLLDSGALPELDEDEDEDDEGEADDDDEPVDEPVDEPEPDEFEPDCVEAVEFDTAALRVCDEPLELD